MTRKTARWIVFFVLLLALPVRFYLGEPELAPVVRLGFLTSLLLAVLVTQGGPTLSLLVGIGVVQTLLYALLLWLAAALLARVLEGFRAPAARSAVLAILALGLFGAALSEIYETPLSSQRSRSNLFQIFD